MPGSALATLTAAFTDEAAIGFDELTALTSSVLTLDQHGAPALTSHGEDAAMLLTLCQQTIAYLTLTQAMTVHALTAATAQARLAADHGPDHAPSATARGRAEGRARTAVLAEAVATCGWDPAHRALVHHLAAMAPDRTQIAARLLAQACSPDPWSRCCSPDAPNTSPTPKSPGSPATAPTSPTPPPSPTPTARPAVAAPTSPAPGA
ncbi:hypothetical protein [Arsenicicoccus piscis]|uniref:DUF222 domain-containing protein n=1 Tax=Arsenicicoccus piscis TaxID=673954 RepID=A0ABQ6HMN4_9MICO|nr:hypothetical protein [Arsenicicoccus piscis]GMA19719.1 hypothetical protein GCM10025862_17400 [Arsenicicoccus piscis]